MNLYGSFLLLFRDLHLSFKAEEFIRRGASANAMWIWRSTCIVSATGSDIEVCLNSILSLLVVPSL